MSTPDGEPESFPSLLLKQAATARKDYFRDFLVGHAHIQKASDQLLKAALDPGDAAFVMLIGPTGSGKTTIGHWLAGKLAEQWQAGNRSSGEIPCVEVTVMSPEYGRFDWIDHYQDVLDGLKDPFNHQRSARPARDIRRAMENSLRQRKPIAILADEAQQFGKTGSGKRLTDQLDHLKAIGDRTGVLYVLLGTYELVPFRAVNAQLGRRSIDIHLRRYDARQSADLRHFKSVVWAFQRNLPVYEEPHLTDVEWEYLYSRSIGCVGTLKQWLRRALALSLEEGGKVKGRTITHKHLAETAPSVDKATQAINDASIGELAMVESQTKIDQLMELVGLGSSKTRGAGKNTAPPQVPATAATPTATDEKPKRRATNRRVGERKPQRDPIADVAE